MVHIATQILFQHPQKKENPIKIQYDDHLFKKIQKNPNTKKRENNKILELPLLTYVDYCYWSWP